MFFKNSNGQRWEEEYDEKIRGLLLNPSYKELKNNNTFLVIYWDGNLFVAPSRTLKSFRSYFIKLKDIIDPHDALEAPFVGDVHNDLTTKIMIPTLVMHPETHINDLHMLSKSPKFMKLLNRAFPSISIYSHEFQRIV
jgi:hypothetical protein